MAYATMENVCTYICAYIFREVNEEYSKEVLRVTDKVLELLSEGLRLEGKVLRSSLGGEEMQLEMKINMYPPCPQPELALGVEPHTDMSALTILVPNDVPGLQVWKDGAWVAVDYIPDALFVHVGDQIEVRTCTLPTYILSIYLSLCCSRTNTMLMLMLLQVLSNGKHKSVLHRSLVNKERTRMSWAVFIVPPHEAVIGPRPELLNDHNPPKYSAKTFAEYRHRKFNKLPQ